MAPRTRSSHMNLNRSCPGVPKRYRIRSLPSVMRPKSMATVVDVLPVLVPPVSSIPSATLVMAASVVRGAISEMEPTNVVFPTANPPATMILTGRGTPSSSGSFSAEAGASERLKAIEHPFEQFQVGALFARLGVLRLVAGQQALFGHVAHEHPGDPERHMEVGGDLRDGDGRRAERDDLLAFERQSRRRRDPLGGDLDEGLERQVDGRARATLRDHVRTYAERGTTFFELVAGHGHRGSVLWSSAR